VILERTGMFHLDLVDNDGRTPLSLAAGSGALSGVLALLSFQADPHQQSHTGLTPLHYASSAGASTIVCSLIAVDADIEARGAFKGTEGCTPLTVASLEGHAEIVDILASRGAKLEARSAIGGTPLSAAAFRGHVDVAAALLGAHANVDAVETTYGRTPIMIATQNCRVAMVGFLIASGAKLGLQPVVPSSCSICDRLTDGRFPTCCLPCRNSNGAEHGPNCDIISRKSLPPVSGFVSSLGYSEAVAQAAPPQLCTVCGRKTDGKHPTCCLQCHNTNGAAHGPNCNALNAPAAVAVSRRSVVAIAVPVAPALDCSQVCQGLQDHGKDRSEKGAAEQMRVLIDREKARIADIEILDQLRMSSDPGAVLEQSLPIVARSLKLVGAGASLVAGVPEGAIHATRDFLDKSFPIMHRSTSPGQRLQEMFPLEESLPAPAPRHQIWRSLPTLPGRH